VSTGNYCTVTGIEWGKYCPQAEDGGQHFPNFGETISNSDR